MMWPKLCFILSLHSVGHRQLQVKCRGRSIVYDTEDTRTIGVKTKSYPSPFKSYTCSQLFVGTPLTSLPTVTTRQTPTIRTRFPSSNEFWLTYEALFNEIRFEIIKRLFFKQNYRTRKAKHATNRYRTQLVFVPIQITKMYKTMRFTRRAANSPTILFND